MSIYWPWPVTWRFCRAARIAVEVKMPVVRRPQEARLAGAQGRPDIARLIDGTQDNEGQQRIELPVLVDQAIPHHAAADIRHARIDAGMALQDQLAFMPG